MIDTIEVYIGILVRHKEHNCGSRFRHQRWVHNVNLRDCAQSKSDYDKFLAGVKVAGSCFIIVRHNERLSWNDANANCRRLGGVLASLSHYDTWLHLWRVFRFYRSRQFDIFIGLKSSPDGYPLMYWCSLHWIKFMSLPPQPFVLLWILVTIAVLQLYPCPFKRCIWFVCWWWWWWRWCCW